jgi:hypothetical protein
MARGQGAAGDPGTRAAPRLTPRPTVSVHDLVQARAALAAAGELGLEVELATAPGLASLAGVGFCVALGELAGRPILVDCGDAPGTALAALRAGARRVLLRGAPAARGKLADIAAQQGAELLAAPPGPLLALAPGEDPAPALRAWRARRDAADPS